ncbi:hypothetical protein JVU11DRAFT_6825 [Chiua virens]|nr:hypothetical protein JVU11DRAFT_6825 [Chiua virens]
MACCEHSRVVTVPMASNWYVTRDSDAVSALIICKGSEQREEGFEDEEDAEGWQGNRRRRLWKSTCIKAALNPNLSDPERVLYAALAPTPQTFNVLKSACRTWEDHYGLK